MKIAVAMSGGTSPVINASLYGIQAKLESVQIFDSLFFLPNGGYGAQGLVPRRVPSLEALEGIGFSGIPGSSFTGTGRGDWGNISQLAQSLVGNKFDAFINIGGNGTLQNSIALSKELQGADVAVCNIPKTVDNDLGDLDREMMHVTPGYGSSLEYLSKILHSLEIESVGAHTHDKAMILQTFGRNTGFLSTGSSAMMNGFIEPLVTVIPEAGVKLEQVMTRAEDIISKHDRVIIVLAEGQEFQGLDTKEHRDQSGQLMHGTGITTPAQYLANILTANGIRGRVCIPTVLQRIGNRIQNNEDRKLAEKVGASAASELLKGSSDFLVGINPEFETHVIAFEEAISFSRRLGPSDIGGPFEPSALFLNYVAGLETKFGTTNQIRESIRFDG